MKFVAKLYELQTGAGRLFLHEHSATASSWQLNRIMKLAAKENVQIATADLCMFGLKTMSTNAGEAIREVFAKKPTKFMTNSARIAEELSRRCKGLHRHQRLMGGKKSRSCGEGSTRTMQSDMQRSTAGEEREGNGHQELVRNRAQVEELGGRDAGRQQAPRDGRFRYGDLEKRP